MSLESHDFQLAFVWWQVHRLVYSLRVVYTSLVRASIESSPIFFTLFLIVLICWHIKLAMGKIYFKHHVIKISNGLLKKDDYIY